MGLSELSAKLGRTETVHIDLLNIDVQIKKLSVKELENVNKLTESCSTGSGSNRNVTNLTKLSYNLVKMYFTDTEGNPLAGKDTEEDAADWPSELTVELLVKFRKVNKLEDAPDPN
jgi:hypothetical protein